MRTFDLVRDADISGVSGTGRVAQGVEFDDGVVALRWIVPPGNAGHGYPTSVVFHDNGMRSVEQIHGHSGATRIVYTHPVEPSKCEDPDCYHPARVCLGHSYLSSATKTAGQNAPIKVTPPQYDVIDPG